MALIALTKTSTEFGEISIVQNRVAGSHVYWQEGWAQSEPDRNGVSLAAYVHAIFGLVAQTADRGALMIGCGGGTLGTMLASAVHTVTVVDINPQSIALRNPRCSKMRSQLAFRPCDSEVVAGPGIYERQTKAIARGKSDEPSLSHRRPYL